MLERISLKKLYVSENSQIKESNEEVTLDISFSKKKCIYL